MKKYIAIAVAALGVLNFSACNKFLDYSSQGSPTQDNYFQNDQQAIDAVASIYARLIQENCMGREMYWEQACANDIVWGRTRSYPTLATLNYTGDEGCLRDVFSGIYTQGINRCNWIVQSLLDKQANTELTPVEKRSLGEAYFMRGYWHFLAAYRYGTKDLGVPFVAYETVEGGYNNEIPEQQATVMDNYKLIIADLQKAEEILPAFEEYDAADRGRAHKAAAVAVMAKVYAYWATWDKSQWANVIPCVNKLETTYGRDLAPEFTDLFAPDFDKFWTKEYCWGWPSNGGQAGGGGGSMELPGVMLENKGWGKFNGWGQFKPSYDIYEEMLKDGAGNIRLVSSILEYGQEFQYFGETRKFWSTSDVEAGFMINKYMQAFAPEDPIGAGWVYDNADWPCTRINWPIVRFGDCLLLRAEAYLATGDAGKATIDLNRIRARAHLGALPGVATWTDLYHERRCELAFELSSDHAYDCKRWAYSGEAEIKALALAELNSHPRARHYEDRSDPNSAFTVGPYEDYQTPAKVWNEKFMTFPYPSQQISKSAGKLQNPPSWR
ncbi:MAG: RagB/SusD family nutrient uptake outer membrane protein [Bacteroidales bacterium]|nr:RagB/SusD family nutrient uptake outer membrane protein [Bacteroidales bacterium]MBQ9701539.1 RagB/SusD family nutrient uptake outer membrane protein [Bacteroidales bacterium]MBR1782083.1 RagB/SusD family nutrient uptake outer membrane protein [Bacteroidales bacterium]